MLCMTKNITPNNNINQIDFLLQVSQSLLTYGKHNILQASVNTCRNKDAPTLMTTLKKARRSIVINGLIIVLEGDNHSLDSARLSFGIKVNGLAIVVLPKRLSNWTSLCGSRFSSRITRWMAGCPRPGIRTTKNGHNTLDS